MRNTITIIRFSLVDLLKQKSVYAFLAVCCLGLLISKGCVSGDYVVNGNKVDSIKIFWHASAIVFQLVVLVAFLLTGILSSKVFSQDRSDGSLVAILARPVHRYEYIVGKILGTWLFCFVFMFVMHLVWSLIVWSQLEATIPGFLTASLVSSINLLFITLLVCLLSLFIPDFLSALIAFVVILIGFISDGGYQFFSSAFVQKLSNSEAIPDVALWRVAYPKVMMLQGYTQSLIKDTDFIGMGSVHPILNLLGYITVFFALIIFLFNKKDI